MNPEGGGTAAGRNCFDAAIGDTTANDSPEQTVSCGHSVTRQFTGEEA
jgi:hypothetical protein